MDCDPDHKTFRRLNAMHLLLIGTPYDLVLRNSRVAERSLRLWIRRLNESGIDSLTYKPLLGRPRILDCETLSSEILPVVDDPSLAGENHSTGRKLHGWLRGDCEIDISYRTVFATSMSRTTSSRCHAPCAEPRDPEQWEIQREGFVSELLTLLKDGKNSVFFGDEAGFEGDPRPRRRWFKRGSRPEQGYHGGHLRQNVVRTVNPEDDQLVSLIVPHSDTRVYQALQDTMAKEVS